MAKQEQQAQEPMPQEEITLKNDAGADITFVGRLMAENSFYDEDTGVLTQQKIYTTNKNHQAYSVVSSDGRTKERRAYLLKREGRLCRIHNGLFDVTVNADDVLTVVKGLCGITEEMRYEEFFADAGQPTQEKAVNE
jgi:hypothetical protein